MKRRALLLFALSFIGLSVWLCRARREDVRSQTPQDFQVVALVDAGGSLDPVLLKWWEYQERQAKGEALASLIPEAEVQRVERAIQGIWSERGGDTCELGVETLSPDRQRITLKTMREGFGGPLMSTSTYEATASQIYPQEERVRFISAMHFILAGFLAATFTVAVLVPWALAEWLIRRRRAGAVPAPPSGSGRP